MNFEVINFGCRLNAYESEVIRKQLEGAEASEEKVIVFNSCAVTAEAERQLQQAIRKARRHDPTVKIIVTGCAAQIDPSKYGGMAEVDRVLGNVEKLQAESYRFDPLQANEPRVRVADIMAVRELAPHLIAGFGSRSRAFIEVQQGCDHRCSFCIIPFGRGNSRSVPVGAVIEQINQLVATGCAEVVLTGVDLTSWGADLPGQPRLGELVKRILRLVPDLPRLRLSSLDPSEFDDDLWQVIAAEPRLMPHLHLSIQSGSDIILKRMKRRHLAHQALEVVERARQLRPDMVFGADFIAGFPTESEDDFAASMDLARQSRLTFLHVFPYSIRSGTVAERMPQLSKSIISQRAKRFRSLGDELRQNYFNSRIGQTETIVLEERIGDEFTGHTEYFAPIKISSALNHNYGSKDIVQARVTAASATMLHATLVLQSENQSHG
ncbi:MAG: tRNA (N(6)-L-threonylcarbamoyladenosine(37)-C(2))-methylthiotransferase MtaB [Candidatus Pacebacteria bacterium]|nr:tRNA (N(6)-L-threonylcarbamoyladenosine(37)-C(2))-methylthiotransferase MtaB [Candidatus Paceibacterota bacterium]